MFAQGDPVKVQRDGVLVATVLCGWDPAQSKLYGPYGADIRQGDTLLFRGRARRVVAEVEQWMSPFTRWRAGSVITVEKAAAHLRDLGRLERSVGTQFDPLTNKRTTQWESVWDGPCLVDPPTTAGGEVDAGQQQISVQPFTVSVPLEVTDISPGYRFIVTASDDPRAVGRPLAVTRVEAASLAQVRVFTAVDNQG